jgi:hypothetical protein
VCEPHENRLRRCGGVVQPLRTLQRQWPTNGSR